MKRPFKPKARGRSRPSDVMKRLTIDVPLELHTRVKIESARRAIKMVDAVRELLEREFSRR